MTDEIKARFMEKVDKCENGCWLWNAFKDKDGYGQFTLNGRNIGSHCASYVLFKGERNGLLVLHSCDVRACVNPDHLHLGTHKKNMREMVERNRQAKGEKHGMAKLSDEIVLSIKQAFKNDTVKIGRRERLKDKFPTITLDTLKDIIYGRTWTHIIV